MATYTLTMRFHVNGGTITDSPHQSGDYYFKVTSNYVYQATSASGTYSYCTNTRTATSGSSGNSKKVYVNLWNVATFGLTRTGYHIDGTKAYRVGSASSTIYVNQDTASTSDTNAATAYRLNSNAYVSANKTVVLYANWIANTYTINYSANGGSFSGTAPTTSATYNSNVTFSSTTPTRTGYTFLGWSSSSTATSATWTAGQTTTTAPNLTSANNGSVTVYAVWQGNTYYMLLDENQASTNTIGLIVKNMQYGSTTNSTVSIPTRYGHTFNGYYTSLSEGTQVYDSSGSAVSGTYWTEGGAGTWSMQVHDRDGWLAYSSYMGTDGYDLYVAHYPLSTSATVRKYNITDWSYTELNNFNSTALTYYNSYTGMNPEPTSRGDCSYFVNLQGRTFGIEYYDTGREDSYSNADIKEWIPGTTWQYTDNLVLYAHWTPNNYSYTLNPNGGTYDGATTAVTKTVTYGTNLNSNPGVPIRAGYQFDGWYTSGGMRVFDSAGFPISDYLGGYWMQSYPQYYYRSSGTYLRYGDFVWGYVNSSDGGAFAFWDGDIGEWHEVYLGQNAQSNEDFHAIGNIVCSRELSSGGNKITYAGVNCNLADNTITYPYTTTLYNNIGDFSVERLYGNSWYGNVGIDYIWIGKTSPTLYAHWTPTVYLKQNGSWSGCSPQIKVNDEWKTPNAIYVKSNGTWQLTWSPSVYTIDTVTRTNVFTFKQEGWVRIKYDLTISGTANTDGTYSDYILALSRGDSNTSLNRFDINVSNGVFTVTVNDYTYTTLDGTKTNKLYIYSSSGIASEITGWHITGTISIT